MILPKQFRFLLHGVSGLLLSMAFVCSAGADQGCIDCHSSQEKLIQNLSKEKPKKSAMTSGAG